MDTRPAFLGARRRWTALVLGALVVFVALWAALRGQGLDQPQVSGETPLEHTGGITAGEAASPVAPADRPVREAAPSEPEVTAEATNVGVLEVTVEGLHHVEPEPVARVVLERQVGPGAFDEVATVDLANRNFLFPALPFGVYRVAATQGARTLARKQVVHRAETTSIKLLLVAVRGYQLEVTFSGNVRNPEVRTWPETTVVERAEGRLVLAVANEVTLDIVAVDAARQLAGRCHFNPRSVRRAASDNRLGPVQIEFGAFAVCAFDVGRVPDAATLSMSLSGRSEAYVKDAIEGGRAVLSGLPAGNYGFEVRSHRGAVIGTLMAGEQATESVVRLSAGERRNVVLLPRPTSKVSGHVRRGTTPVSDALVTAFEDRPDAAFAGVMAPTDLRRPAGSVRSDKSGAFEIDLPAIVKQVVLLAQHEVGASFPVCVSVPRDDVELVVSPSCEVSGTAGSSFVEMRQLGEGEFAAVFPVQSDRSFSAGRLPQGRYRVTLLTFDGATIVSGTHELVTPQVFLQLEAPKVDWTCTFGSVAASPRTADWVVGNDRGRFEVPAGVAQVTFQVRAGAGATGRLECASQRVRSVYCFKFNDAVGQGRVMAVPPNEATFSVRLGAGQTQVAMVLVAKPGGPVEGPPEHVTTTIDVVDATAYAIPRGTYDIVEVSGRVHARNVGIAAGEAFELDLTRQADCEVTVQVVRMDGKPLAGAFVHAVSKGEDAGAPSRTDADGNATLRVRRSDDMTVRLYRRQDDFKLTQRIWSNAALQEGVRVTWNGTAQSGAARLVVDLQ